MAQRHKWSAGVAFIHNEKPWTGAHVGSKK